MIICPRCKATLAIQDGGYGCSGCGHFFKTLDGVTDLTHEADECAQGFNADFFEEFHRKESRHFWHNGRKHILLWLVKKYYRPGDRIIEIGCGSGNIVQFFNQHGIKAEGGDVFFNALKFARRKCDATFFRLDINKLPFSAEYNMIGLFDVLEHIDDDYGALVNIRNALKGKGMLLLTVPAGRNLWSKYDEFYSHRRRYEKDELAALLARAGFRPIKLSFYVFFLHPLVYFTRRFLPKYASGSTGLKKSDAVDASPAVNILLTPVMLFEAFLTRFFNLPFGSSLIVVAEKSGD